MGLKSTIAGLVLAASAAVAHPDVAQAHAARPLKLRGLDHCEKRFQEESFVKRTVTRHSEELAALKAKRDYRSVSQIDHQVDVDVTLDSDATDLFADAGACMLMPAVDQGPLYVMGEEVRRDITEGEDGIKMTLAIQVIDYNTCEVVPNAYLDIWSSNATGQYVGVQGYPGMGDPNDATILEKTAMRGVQPVDDNGIAVFDALMPGHYDGRATHIHTIVYLDATLQENGTITGGRAAQIGQIYFDQSLVSAVDVQTPYNSNTMTIVPNVDDFLFQAGANGDDPIVRYATVGDDVGEGLFAWIRFGIDVNADKFVDPAAWWTEDGGVMNPEGPISNLGGGFGGFGGFGRKKRTAAEKQ